MTEKIRPTIDYNYLDKFSNEVLNLNKSNRWVGVTNEIGVQLIEKYRAGSTAFLTREENEEYASHTIARHKKRLKFEPKIGPLDYALVKYEKVIRAIIPITDDYYLLIALDVEEKYFDRIIMEKIIPFIEGEKRAFEVTSGIANK
ncbi:MAG: hypothetical protein WCF23_15900 [Candidatus Nitrosopolaris sp.]